MKRRQLNQVLLLFILLLAGTLLPAKAILAESFKTVHMTTVSSPTMVKRLVESDANISFSHNQQELGKLEKEYITFNVTETGWVGFETKYHSDVDAGGGKRATTLRIYADPEMTQEVTSHPLPLKAMVKPGTYYAVATFYGSYSYFGYFFPCSKAVPTAEIVCIPSENSENYYDCYLNASIPDSITHKTMLMRYVPLPQYLKDLNLSALNEYASIIPLNEWNELHYKNKTYPYRCSIKKEAVEKKQVYFILDYYATYSSVDDDWLGYQIVVPVKIIAIEPKDSTAEITYGTAGLKTDQIVAKDKLLFKATSNGKLEIIGPVSKKITSITIPQTKTINGKTYNVSGIADGAFKNCKKLTSIRVPGSIRRIGKEAFMNCTALKSAYLPSGITAIPSKMFYGCKALKTITIPKKTKSIGSSAFEKCTSLQKVVIPAAVTTLGKRCFYGCSKLANVTIQSKKLSKFGSYTFTGSKKGMTIKVPSSKLKTYKNKFKSRDLPKNAKIK